MLLTAIIAYLGLFAGVIVSYLSRDELSIGRIYFHLSQAAILSCLAVITLYLHYAWWVGAFILLSLLLYIFSWRLPSQSVVIYPLLAVVLLWNSVSPTSSALNASLIFLYGIPTASLQLNRGWTYPMLYNLGFIGVTTVVLLL